MLLQIQLFPEVGGSFEHCVVRGMPEVGDAETEMTNSSAISLKVLAASEIACRLGLDLPSLFLTSFWIASNLQGLAPPGGCLRAQQMALFFSSICSWLAITTQSMQPARPMASTSLEIRIHDAMWVTGWQEQPTMRSTQSYNGCLACHGPSLVILLS